MADGWGYIYWYIQNKDLFLTNHFNSTETLLSKFCQKIQTGDIMSPTLLELTSGMCRWPSGDPKEDLQFCGAPSEPGLSYCDKHMAASRAQHKPRRMAT